MKIQFFNRFAVQSVLLAWFALSASSAPNKGLSPTHVVENGKGTVAKTNAVETLVSKSVFEDDAKNGKDPLFPKSSRRGKSSPSQSPVLDPLSQISLKGISGSGIRRFALINNQPLAAGETALVKISTGQIHVHCWQVSENSAVISIKGDSVKKELSLRNGL